MLILGRNPKRRKKSLMQKKTLKIISIFCFPNVKGLEGISKKLQNVAADSLFSALIQIFSLHRIKTEEEAVEAEKILEYLERAFEVNCPPEIVQYKEVLMMLISDFDERHYVAAAADMEPHLFLKLLLEESGLCQKALVPSCFKSESQISEFLHQKKGRKHLSYAQATALGSYFGVDVLNFLR